MDKTLRQFRIIWGALLLSIFLYAFVAERVAQPARTVNTAVVEAVSLICVSIVVSIFIVRRLVIAKAMSKLALQPEDANTLARWRIGTLLTLALCESVAMFGVVVRCFGCTFAQAGIFYFAALVLMIFLMPRRPEQVLGE